MKIRTLIFLAACLPTGLAFAQDNEPKPARPLQDVDLLSYNNGTSKTLVLKNGTQYFKVQCDDLNRLASMVRNIGFDPTADLLEIRDEHTTIVTDIIAGITTNDPLRCKGYVAATGEGQNRYFYSQYTPKNPNNNQPDPSRREFFVQLIKGVKSTLFEMKCPANIVAALELKTLPSGGPSTVSDAVYNAGKTPFKCTDGVKPVQPSGRVFTSGTGSSDIVAGKALSVQPLMTAPTSHVHVKKQTCPWIRWNDTTKTIEGQPYPSTVPYACTIELSGETTESPEDYAHTVRVEPLKIKQFTSGYRRVCALLNNGSVSCSSPKDNISPTSAQPIKYLTQDIEIARGATHIALSLSSVATFQTLYYVKDNQLYAYKYNLTNPTPTKLADVSDVARLKAGAEPVCVETRAGSVTCYGDRVAQYRLPTVATAMNGFDLGSGDLCWLKPGDTAIKCNVTGYTVNAASVIAYANAFDGLCWIGTDAKLACTSTNPANPLTQIHSDPNLKSVAVGLDFGCTIDIFGKARCWGKESVGQTLPHLNLNDTTKALPITDMKLGYDHGCYMTDSSQTLICWGGQFFNDDPISGMKRRMDINLLLPSLSGWEVYP